MFTKTPAAHRPFKLALIASVAIVAAAISAPSMAADTATASASAKVITPISIANVTNLSFGSFAATAAGNVTVTTNGTRSADAGIVLSGGPTGTAASFTITGETDATFTIDYDATTTTLISGGNSMGLTLISGFTADGATSGETTTGTLTGGSQTLRVGGVLAVGASQAVGTYAGTVSAQVAYN